MYHLQRAPPVLHPTVVFSVWLSFLTGSSPRHQHLLPPPQSRVHQGSINPASHSFLLVCMPCEFYTSLGVLTCSMEGFSSSINYFLMQGSWIPRSILSALAKLSVFLGGALQLACWLTQLDLSEEVLSHSPHHAAYPYPGLHTRGCKASFSLLVVSYWLLLQLPKTHPSQDTSSLSSWALPLCLYTELHHSPPRGYGFISLGVECLGPLVFRPALLLRGQSCLASQTCSHWHLGLAGTSGFIPRQTC